MKNDRKRFFLADRFKSFGVLAIRFFMESAAVIGLYFLLKSLASYHLRLLFFAVPAAVILLAALRIPLRFGTLLFFIDREFYEVSSMKDLFLFFSPALFFSAIKGGLIFLGFHLLCLLIFFLPCLSMLALMCYNISNLSPMFLSVACFLAFLLLLFSAAAAFFKIKKLTFLSGYLFVLSPKKNAFDCLSESAEILNGRTSLVTAVKMKNFLSRLLCVLVLPAGFITRRCSQRKSHLAYELLKERK